MSIQVPTAFVQQYRANTTHLAQQKGSRLQPAVRNEMVNGEFAYFDQIGAAAATLVTSRHGDTPLNETPHSRRQVGMADYEYADLIDSADKVRLLQDPAGEYTRAAVMAMGRAKDDVVIAALGGTAKTGKTGSTSTVLPSGQKIVIAASGLTLAKLLAAKELLDAAENDPDEARFVACPAKDITVLLNTTEVKSSDYNTVKALASGQIDTFLGFKFIRTQRLLTDANADRQCFAWTKSALLLAIGKEVEVDVGLRRDKRVSTQVYVRMSLAATRMEEVGVVEIATTP